MNKDLMQNLFQTVNELVNKVQELENKIEENERSHHKKMMQIKSDIIRVKNNDDISSNFLLSHAKYYDLSPSQAFKLYNSSDQNFILLDVSDKNFSPPVEIKEAVKIPFNELSLRIHELINKHLPIYVISENGVTSIKACEMLNNYEYYYVNNISGGYKFWPGVRYKSDNSSDSDHINLIKSAA